MAVGILDASGVDMSRTLVGTISRSMAGAVTTRVTVHVVAAIGISMAPAVLETRGRTLSAGSIWSRLSDDGRCRRASEI